MRGVHSAVDEIRRNVFTEVARLAYEGGDLNRVDMIPYTIVPGEVARHRHDVFLERAIVQERVRLALVEKGVLRETAYDWVQRNALNSWENEIDFEYLVLEDKDISAYLSREEIMDLFDMDYHTKNIDYIFARAGLN